MGHRGHPLLTLAIMAALGFMLIGGGRVLAQDETATVVSGDALQTVPAEVEEEDAGGEGVEGPVETHPAAIHAGTCSEPTPEPAFDAGDVQPFTNDEGQALAPEEIQGTLTTPPVLTSTATEIEANLDDITGQPHVLVVHNSEDDFATLIACGELAGSVRDDQLVVALRPLNMSGYAGTATLSRDGDNTSSNIYLFSQVEAISGAAPAAPVEGETPTPGPTAAPTPPPTAVPTETPAPTQPPVPTATPAPPPPTEPPAPTATVAPTATIVVEVTATAPPA